MSLENNSRVIHFDYKIGHRINISKMYYTYTQVTTLINVSMY